MVDKKAAADAIEAFLRALGHEPTGDLAETGARVADAWADDLLAGEAVDAAAVLRAGSIPLRQPSQGLVVVRDISVVTMCPHHLLPAQGTALVAYMPTTTIAGVGTIAQLVSALARRLTLQEQLGDAIADVLMTELGARAALCKLSLSHACLSARGERETAARVETLALVGSFAHESTDRALALATLARA